MAWIEMILLGAAMLVAAAVVWDGVCEARRRRSLKAMWMDVDDIRGLCHIMEQRTRTLASPQSPIFGSRPLRADHMQILINEMGCPPNRARPAMDETEPLRAVQRRAPVVHRTPAAKK